MKETGKGSWLIKKGKNSGLYGVEIKNKKHGGKRKGAGRPKLKPSEKKEPTKLMRIPLSKVAAVLATIGKA